MKADTATECRKAFFGGAADVGFAMESKGLDHLHRLAMGRASPPQVWWRGRSVAPLAPLSARRAAISPRLRHREDNVRFGPETAVRRAASNANRRDPPHLRRRAIRRQQQPVRAVKNAPA